MDPSWLDYMDSVMTALLAIAGLILANSYAQQRRLKIAEDRIGVYQELWRKVEPARASRLRKDNPLTRKEAEALARSLRCWYHQGGGGILLPIPTLKMFLLILEDLECLTTVVGPAAADELGKACIHRISILRTQLKIDLDIYDIDDRAQLKENVTKREFLQRACFDIKRWGRPHRWYRAKSFHWHHYTGRHRGWSRLAARSDPKTVGILQACPDHRGGQSADGAARRQGATRRRSSLGGDG